MGPAGPAPPGPDAVPGPCSLAAAPARLCRLWWASSGDASALLAEVMHHSASARAENRRSSAAALVAAAAAGSWRRACCCAALGASSGLCRWSERAMAAPATWAMHREAPCSRPKLERGLTVAAGKAPRAAAGNQDPAEVRARNGSYLRCQCCWRARLQEHRSVGATTTGRKRCRGEVFGRGLPSALKSWAGYKAVDRLSQRWCEPGSLVAASGQSTMVHQVRARAAICTDMGPCKAFSVLWTAELMQGVVWS